MTRNRDLNEMLPSEWLSCNINSQLLLPNNEIHVWRASLDQPPAVFEYLKQCLSPDELARASRYVFEQDEKRFIVSRGILRSILASYLGMQPVDVRLSYGTHGKPFVENSATAADEIQFNVSHSEDVALYVIDHHCSIGVDVEKIRLVPEIDDIAGQFFSQQENASLRSLPIPLRREAFFNCWTRKEAYLKARGDGLSLPLNQFEVSLIPGEPAVLLSVQGDRNMGLQWSLFSLSPALEYVAAIAVFGRNWRNVLWQWGDGRENTLESAPVV